MQSESFVANWDNKNRKCHDYARKIGSEVLKSFFLSAKHVYIFCWMIHIFFKWLFASVTVTNANIQAEIAQWLGLCECVIRDSNLNVIDCSLKRVTYIVRTELGSFLECILWIDQSFERAIWKGTRSWSRVQSALSVQLFRTFPIPESLSFHTRHHLIPCFR